jgi:hypothetical protein
MRAHIARLVTMSQPYELSYLIKPLKDQLMRAFREK